jgi:ABC-type Na+ efflux pump permease subunit
METVIWVLALLAVVVIIVIYVITSVGSYSNSFIGKFFKGDKDTGTEEDDKKN